MPLESIALMSTKQIGVLDYFVKISVKKYCPPSIKEISRKLGHKIDIVHWYLSRLQHHGFVYKSEPGRWMMTEKCMKCYGVLTFEQIKELKNSRLGAKSAPVGGNERINND